MSIAAVSKETPTYLDWTQRPQSIKEAISDAFETLTRDHSSQWGLFNGDYKYTICGVNEHALMKKIIQQASSDQKDFYALDIGAGNFQWSQALAKFIDRQTDLPPDIKVHIIGVRGETYSLENRVVVETDRCKIYYLGACKIEELSAEFQKQELDLENKLDLVVSRWCFRHLVDSLGTFIQAYNLLRPGTGFFLLDGFNFLYGNEELGTDLKMTQLFLDIKVPFLMRDYNLERSADHFMLRRLDATPCQVEMSYLRMIPLDRRGRSWRTTEFTRTGDRDAFTLPEEYRHSGDKKMHEWLKQNELLSDRYIVWQPLQDKDLDQVQPALHRVIQEGGTGPQVRECLEQGEDINASDAKGRTALHISIQTLNYELFQLLLSYHPHLGLQNGKGHTALDEAIIADTQGLFLRGLIAAGVNVHAYSGKWEEKSPLGSAIEAKNLIVVEILIQAGVEISYLDYHKLKEPAFSSLHEQGLIPPPTPEQSERISLLEASSLDS